MPQVRLFPNCVPPSERHEGIMHDIQDPELHLAASVTEVRFEGEKLAVHAVLAYICPRCGHADSAAVSEKEVDLIQTCDVGMRVIYKVDEFTRSLQQ